MFLFWLRQLLQCRDPTPPSVLQSSEVRSSSSNAPVLPLVHSSYRVLLGSMYSFPLIRYSCLLSTGVLHACTSVSECTFLMYPWREMYSMSTYSSAILFSCWKIFDYSFDFLACDWSVQIMYLFLVHFWNVILFKEFVHFFQVVHFTGI